MLCALTAYFNPQRFVRRRANLTIFRERLQLPLIAVELGFDSQFELGTADAEILIRVGSGDVLWQKERLLNIALEQLPAACDKVLVIDCDVFFERSDWQYAVQQALETSSIVQAFSTALHLDQSWSPAASPDDHAMFRQRALTACDAPAHELTLATRRSRHSAAVGHAWAFRTDAIVDVGLFDSCIVGGGDSAIAAAAFRVPTAVVDLHRMTSGQESRYRVWVERFSGCAAGGVASVDGVLAHLWHGSMSDRAPGDRHGILVDHAFDPDRDICTSADGAWCWNSDKPGLHQAVRNYFAGRREDGNEPNHPAVPIAVE